MLLKDLKNITSKGQKIEIFAYPNDKTGFKGFERVYYVRHMPKKYDNLKVVYIATEHRYDGVNNSLLIADCRQ